MSYILISRCRTFAERSSNPVSWIDEGGKRIRHTLIPPFQLRLAPAGSLSPSELHHVAGGELGRDRPQQCPGRLQCQAIILTGRPPESQVGPGAWQRQPESLRRPSVMDKHLPVAARLQPLPVPAFRVHRPGEASSLARPRRALWTGPTRPQGLPLPARTRPWLRLRLGWAWGSQLPNFLPCNIDIGVIKSTCVCPAWLQMSPCLSAQMTA